MKFTMRKPKIGLWGLALILAALLAVTSQAFAFRFVVLADSPDNETNKTAFNQNALEYVRDRILNMNPQPDMIFFLGDLVTKAKGKVGDLDNQPFLPLWKEVMRPIAQAGIKIYVAIGNRELYPVTGWPPIKALEGEFQNYFGYDLDPDFTMPGNGPDNPYNYKYLAYSVSHENAFFVVLDTFAFKADGLTNWDNGLDAQQLAWFQAQATQSTAKYKFVLTHGPAFSPEGWSVDPSLPQTLWGIMQDNHFAGYFCGHEHIYSRWLIDKSLAPRPTPQITQVLTGSVGALPDQIFKVKQNRNKVRAFSLYNYVVGDIDGRGAHFQTYGIDLNAGKYSTKVIDRFSLAN